MILILKKISPNALVTDIEHFIKPALVGGLLKKSGRIERITIQMLTQANPHTVEYNSLVRVEPDVVGKRVIKLLNRKPLNGKYINIAEYDFRHRDNDRRISRYKKINDRRNTDRRRRQLVITDITQNRVTPTVDHSHIGWITDSTV